MPIVGRRQIKFYRFNIFFQWKIFFQVIFFISDGDNYTIDSER